MSTRFFTNAGENTLLKKFAGVFAHNPDLAEFDALVGYLRASGYFALQPHLEKVPLIRILVGIDVDALLAASHRKGLLHLGDANKTLDEVRKELQRDIARAPYRKEVEDGIRKFVVDVAEKRVQIRAHPTKRLHAKMYIFLPPGFSEHKPGSVITGSSNLTAAGLGKEEIGSNYEFNVLLHDYDDVKFAADEFAELWNQGVDVLPEAVRRAVHDSYLRDDLTPFDLYMKFLIEYFGPAIEYDPNVESDLPKGYKNLSYQADAVNDGWLKLQKHGGFFLADVVGLGKTIVAARIAKKFYYHNGFPAHRSRILVVVSPAMKETWQIALEKFGIDDCTRVLPNGSLHKIKPADAEKYDLIMVDEAHKFRNDTAGGYTLLQKLCKTRTRHRLPDGGFAAKQVILITATPLNNEPEDIRNLVLLFQDGKNSTVIGNLQHFFALRIKEYDIAKRIDEERKRHAEIIRIYEMIREQVVTPLTVRRTRRDLMEDKRYKADLEQQGIIFPHVEKPTPILYQLPPQLDALYDRTIRLLAAPEPEGLTYNRYRAIAFLSNLKLREKYERADLVAQQLATIMKTLLVKRLDSSFVAFTKSLRRFRDATDAMVRMFESGRVYIAPNLNVSEYILEDREDELEAAIREATQTDPTITIAEPSDFRSGFLQGLKRDLSLLNEFVDQWENFRDVDPKLDEFLRRLNTELLDPKLNETRKLVIFSEARDTTAYLTDKLKKAGFESVLTVDSHNRKAVMPVVRANFDANVPAGDAIGRQDEYKILISTEVLAEGVNLHRAHVVVNYDTPWNSTRLMQRIGRVNRIGTTAKRIYIYNFYPTAQVNSEIELENKAKLKLFAFHSALGEDSGIYSPDESPESFGLFDRAIEEERDERLQFLSFLRDFKDSQPDEFRRIKNLPLRARCGRIARTKDIAGGSLVFIRNERRDAFYQVSQANLAEIGFVEMARSFRAEVAEKSSPLYEKHHDDVRGAVADFREKLEADAARELAIDHTLGPNEQKAIRLLAAATGMPHVSAAEKALLTAAQHAIKLGKFQDLPRKLNKLQKDATAKSGKPTVSTAVYLDKLMEIVRGYPLEVEELNDIDQPESSVDLSGFEPKIILSESFTHSGS
jgi:superfamily II DNA or RNA helicase